MGDASIVEAFWGTKKCIFPRTFTQSFTMRKLGLISGVAKPSSQNSWETALTQIFFLSKLVEKYTVVKIKFCWCVKTLSLTLTKQLETCGVPLKNNHQNVISVCLLRNTLQLRSWWENSLRTNRTLWTVTRYLMMTLILSCPCTLSWSN